MLYFIAGNDAVGKGKSLEELSKKLGLEREVIDDEQLILSDVLGEDLFSEMEKKLLVFPACDGWKNAKENWAFLVSSHAETNRDAVFISAKKPTILSKLPKKSYQLLAHALPEKSWELEKWLDAECSARSLKLSASSKQLLLERDPDAASLSTDLERIAAMGATFDESQLDQLLPPTPDGDYFQFLDDLLAGKTEAAMRGLRRLLAGGEEPIGLLTRVSRQLCVVQGVQEGLKMDGMHPYTLRKARAQANTMPSDPRYWAQALQMLLALDLRLRGGKSVDPALDCEDVFLRVMRASENK